VLAALLAQGALGSAVLGGCGSGRTVIVKSGDGGTESFVCALALEACALDRDCCEGSCELGTCSLCRSGGRVCASSSSCCSGVCGGGGTCR